ncbi:MAG: Acetyl esterase/lipase [Hydrocarboniphaga sp.]|uniref:alpha/beta hydrolase n=1 Tax=Hydrocarboniphaga sp. TaxID=2033016 RepID=UPI00260CEA9E|nr:alpha/beta hydrolase [Hydrocarboniphaga sp.]MDB5969396.1 Acetyl esterase/lipase [Hydrocarboniphaga sp.]
MTHAFRNVCLWLSLPLLAALSACSGEQVLNSFTSTKDFQRTQNMPYDPVKNLRLDVYTPANQTKRPVVVFFYGKRWTTGTKDEYEFVGGALARIGYCTVIPDVSLYPMVRFPAFVQDGARVVKWTRDHISDYGCDPKKIFVMGHSSGAHIAAMLALNEQYLQDVGGSRTWLRGMVGLAGPYDFLPLVDPTLRDLFGPPEKFEQSQPIMFTDGRNPPMLLMSGEDDEIVQVSSTRNLAASIGRAGGPVETIIYPKMPHPRLLASIGPGLRGQSDVLDHIKEFLNKWSDANYVNRLNTPGITTTPLPP